MSLATIDWIIILLFVIVLFTISAFTNKYTKSVSDFLAANRCGGRYLLTMAKSMAWVGAITIVAQFQQYYTAGFCPLWWSNIYMPIGLLLSLSGFVIYRYRQTRAMTMGQFFEMRYSRKFRVFAGALAWFSGVINYGIFPAITARFFINFIGIPEHIIKLGSLDVNLTLGAIMFVFLAVAVFMTLCGGQVTLMVTDFIQGQLTNAVFIVTMFVIIFKFKLPVIMDVLTQAGEKSSMLNPFDQGEIPQFTLWFFVMMAINSVYSHMAWQGAQGYNCAARSPHEARMANVLSYWREGVNKITIVLLPVCAFVVLNSSVFPDIQNDINNTLNSLSPSLQKQMTVPVALRYMLPTGVIGLFCVMMIAAALSTDDTYLHSWGVIFVQDIYMQLRKKKEHMSSEKHMKLLRLSVIGVAVFVWFFSMLFPLHDYILMYQILTGTIYIGGAGCVIIGGLYWKRATTQGAWAGMIVGCVSSTLTVFLINIFWPYLLPRLKETFIDIEWLQSLPKEFYTDGVTASVMCSIFAIFCYVTVSLLTKPDPAFSMDKMLNRETSGKESETKVARKRLHKILGITEEFTLFDKTIYYGTICLQVFWFTIFTIGTVYALTNKTTNNGWARYWSFFIYFSIIIGIITFIWFTVGGLKNAIELFNDLRNMRRNEFDDGTVDKTP